MRPVLQLNGLIEINSAFEIDRLVVTGQSRSKNGVASLVYVPVTSLRNALPL
jgi:hypothetical protein